VRSQPKAAEAPSTAPESHAGVTIELGSAVNPPGFDEAMIGVAVGDAKSFTVTFPDDYPVEDLQGAEVDYTVTLHGIKYKELPALDDEFAKDMGEFETLDALRERVRADLQRDAERSQEREIRDDLLKQLAARAGEEVPPSLVDKEIDRRLEQFVGQLADQRIDPMKTGINWEEFRDRQREPALEAVKSLLVLDDIARRESIVVTEEEMEQEIARLADRTGRSADTVRARLGQEGGLSRLRAALRREKAVEFLLSRVTLLNV
jgi:trigger factor